MSKILPYRHMIRCRSFSLMARQFLIDRRPVLEPQLRVKKAPSAIRGAMGARSMLCRLAFHGERKMSGTNRRSTAQRGGLRPSSLVDSQLQHLESVVEFVTRGDASGAQHTLDHEYWEKRIRALEETHELINSQRQRITKLLARLVTEAQVGRRSRSAA
ncbi:hypothetical protein [Paraburkholderia bryophila]|nr:hypothetical protein [Paraburkholderia bryophila]